MARRPSHATPADKVWRPFDGVVTLRGRTTEYDAFHPGELVVGLVDAAGLRDTRSGRPYVLGPGAVGVWHPWEEHAGRPVDRRPWEFRTMNLELPWLFDAVLEPGGPDCGLAFPDPVVEDARLVAQLLDVLNCIQGEDSPAIEREERVVEFAAQLMAHSANAGRVSKRTADDMTALRRAQELLCDRLTEQVGLDELAAVSGTSKAGVIRLFRRRLGTTPGAYQVALRVLRARRMLARGLPLAEVAALSGFFDQPHFNRQFRRMTGMTPGQFERLM